MKNYIKNTWSSYVISLVLSFMLFIFEPINLYSSNLNDFWFDLELLLKPSLVMFLCSFLGLVLIINIIYFINKKVFKYFNIILFISFLCSYIQGNYLVGNLPVLSGEIIDWSKYTIDGIISIILWVIVITLTIIICKKIKMDKYIKYSGYVSLAIFAMLIVSLVSTFLTTDLLSYYKKDSTYSTTYDNFNNYSEDENFLILLLDAVDSMHFKKALENNKEFQNTLKDFTYFPDTMSMHPFTQESIPLILTNNIFENQDKYQNYINNSMKNSRFINYLFNNNYNINIYYRDLVLNDDAAKKVANVNSIGEKIKYKSFIKQELKYELFRYLPFFLKKYSNIDTMNFSQENLLNSDNEYYFEENSFVLEHLNGSSITKEKKKNYKFIHMDGAHTSFTYLKDLSRSEKATYMDEVEACLHISDIYLNKLKENGVYDNSNIIILSDHGFNYNDKGLLLDGRQNPIFFVKGIGEKHDKMNVSDKALSFADLEDLYFDLLNKKTSSDVLQGIGNQRTRRFLLFDYGDTEHMIEYETKDKAWETDKMYETGRKFFAE